jgi:hypothetical protein
LARRVNAGYNKIHTTGVIGAEGRQQYGAGAAAEHSTQRAR